MKVIHLYPTITHNTSKSVLKRLHNNTNLKQVQPGQLYMQYQKNTDNSDSFPALSI